MVRIKIDADAMAKGLFGPARNAIGWFEDPDPKVLEERCALWRALKSGDTVEVPEEVAAQMTGVVQVRAAAKKSKKEDEDQ